MAAASFVTRNIRGATFGAQLLCLATLLLGTARAVASEPRAPTLSSRLIVISDEKGERYRHLLATPALLPNSLVAPYFGVGASASYRDAGYQPFSITNDALQVANIAASLDMALATPDIESPLITRIALRAHLVGEGHSAINAGSFVAHGSHFSGGTDFELALELFQGLRDTPWRLTGVVQVSTRQGVALRPLNAVSVISRNPSDLDLLEGIELISSGLQLVPVHFDQNGARTALAYAYLPSPAFSVQGSLGVQIVGRQLYPQLRPAVTHERELSLPELGIGAQVDLEPLTGSVPVALLAEYRLSQIKAEQKTTDERIEEHRRILTEQDFKDARFPKHVLALGLHYSRRRSANLDAAATVFTALNVDPNREWATGETLAIPSGREVGLIAISRYVW